MHEPVPQKPKEEKRKRKIEMKHYQENLYVCNVCIYVVYFFFSYLLTHSYIFDCEPGL